MVSGSRHHRKIQTQQEKRASVGLLIFVIPWSSPCLGRVPASGWGVSRYLASGLLKFLLKNMAGHGQGFCLLCSRVEWKWHSRICEEGRQQGLAEAGTQGYSPCSGSAWHLHRPGANSPSVRAVCASGVPGRKLARYQPQR